MQIGNLRRNPKHVHIRRVTLRVNFPLDLFACLDSRASNAGRRLENLAADFLVLGMHHYVQRQLQKRSKDPEMLEMLRDILAYRARSPGPKATRWET